MTDKILTADEVSEIHVAAKLDTADQLDVEALCESHELIRAKCDAMDGRRAALSQCLVELRSAAGQALENDQSGLRSAIRAEASSSPVVPA